MSLEFPGSPYCSRGTSLTSTTLSTYTTSSTSATSTFSTSDTATRSSTTRSSTTSRSSLSDRTSLSSSATQAKTNHFSRADDCSSAHAFYRAPFRHLGTNAAHSDTSQLLTRSRIERTLAQCQTADVQGFVADSVAQL